MENRPVQSGGIGLAGALFLIFLVLKLTDNIDWSWFWVFSPLIFSAGLGIVVFLVALLLISRM